jgi:hypothetical protein
MAGVALADDVARLAREAWRQAMVLGWSARLGFDSLDDPGGTLGRIAKAAGCSVETLQAWLDGSAQPTTGQALAVLDALPFPAVNAPALNGSHP